MMMRELIIKTSHHLKPVAVGYSQYCDVIMLNCGTVATCHLACVKFTHVPLSLAYSVKLQSSGAPFHYRNLNLFLTWISKYIHYKASDEITHPVPNFKGATVEFWEWISKFIQHFFVYMITYSCWKHMAAAVKGYGRLWKNRSVPNHIKQDKMLTTCSVWGVNFTCD